MTTEFLASVAPLVVKVFLINISHFVQYLYDLVFIRITCHWHLDDGIKCINEGRLTRDRSLSTFLLVTGDN